MKKPRLGWDIAITCAFSAMGVVVSVITGNWLLWWVIEAAYFGGGTSALLWHDLYDDKPCHRSIERKVDGLDAR